MEFWYKKTVLLGHFYDFMYSNHKYINFEKTDVYHAVNYFGCRTHTKNYFLNHIKNDSYWLR